MRTLILGKLLIVESYNFSMDTKWAPLVPKSTFFFLDRPAVYI